MKYLKILKFLICLTHSKPFKYLKIAFKIFKIVRTIVFFVNLYHLFFK